MSKFKHMISRISRSRFGKAEEGAILVEFALVLPLMLVFFAVLIESAHTFWSYQIAVSGVRDASRYLSRVIPVNICNPQGPIDGYEQDVMDIVSQNLSLNPAMPSTVTVDDINLELNCVAGSFRVSPAPIATVQAQLTIQYPLGFIFEFFGDGLSSVQTSVTDQTRIIGQ